MARKNLHKAQAAGVFRTIPDSNETESVTTSNGTADLTSYGTGTVDLRGKWVFLKARGGDVTIRRYTGSAPTLTAGVGLTIADGKFEEFYVDPDGATNLRHIGSASCNLDVEYDSE